MVRFSLRNSHSAALRKMKLRTSSQGGQLQGFFNSFNLEMNEGLLIQTGYNMGEASKK